MSSKPCAASTAFRKFSDYTVISTERSNYTVISTKRSHYTVISTERSEWRNLSKKKIPHATTVLQMAHKREEGGH